MLNLILLSWLAYFLACFFLLLGSWRIFCILPLTLRLGILFSQMAILFVPARVDATAKAPVFIVLVLDILKKEPANEISVKALPLVLALILAWPLALTLSKLWHKKQLTNDTPTN